MNKTNYSVVLIICLLSVLLVHICLFTSAQTIKVSSATLKSTSHRPATAPSSSKASHQPVAESHISHSDEQLVWNDKFFFHFNDMPLQDNQIAIIEKEKILHKEKKKSQKQTKETEKEPSSQHSLTQNTPSKHSHALSFFTPSVKIQSHGPVELNEQTFFHVMLSSMQPWIVMFHAPCKSDCTTIGNTKTVTPHTHSTHHTAQHNTTHTRQQEISSLKCL